MEFNVGVIPGDGIGPEIVREATKVLDKTGEKYNVRFNYEQILMGGCSIDKLGIPLSDEAIETAKKKDAVLLGAIGGDANTSQGRDCRDLIHNFYFLSSGATVGVISYTAAPLASNSVLYFRQSSIYYYR